MAGMRTLLRRPAGSGILLSAYGKWASRAIRYPRHPSTNREPHMMNSISTSKIVVGIGLAAVFGIGVSELAVHSNQANESQVALNAPTPAMADATSQNAADVTVPAQGVARQ